MWDQRYSDPEYQYGTEPNDFLCQYQDELSGETILSLAEGEGRNAVYLAGLGYQVSAVDSSSVGLAKAESLAQASGVSIHTEIADLADYDLGEAKWDNIISIFCHLPPLLRQALHPRIVKALKPGGSLLLEAYTPQQLEFASGGPPVAEMMLSQQELSDTFAELEIIRLQECVRIINEGVLHTGQGAVVQLVARKPR